MKVGDRVVWIKHQEHGRIVDETEAHEIPYPGWVIQFDDIGNDAIPKDEGRREMFSEYLFGPRMGRTPWWVVGFINVVLLMGLVSAYMDNAGYGWPIGTWVVIHFILVLGAWRNFKGKQL